ncbi:MerR family transcriptional regulator [Cohaesibacter celericrescens]|uniref:MerR family transcriptional regulator n=1 Tax=Cohaesibacter celericrescens TaxID=2067669 RepID=A0A2N5XN01_9HYPH|nr:MerR family transcriptional regulator [Cohaesibacter celericrescens]PLW75797.1 MerR family transcriptional regulator [Cohaesibacter celericrescens]
MKIGDLANLSGLSVHTIRYYEKVGLLPPAHRDTGGQRQYSSEIAGWLRFLRHLKSTGMGISDMVRYAQLRAKGTETAQERRQMLEIQRDKVVQQIALLQSTLPILDKKIDIYRDMERAHIMEADHDNRSKPKKRV